MHLKHIYSDIFEGDGRIVVEAPVWMNCPGSRSKLQRSQTRAFRDMLLAKGHTVHSEMGTTLWVPYAYCMLTNTDFELKFVRISGTGAWMLTLLNRQLSATEPTKGTTW